MAADRRVTGRRTADAQDAEQAARAAGRQALHWRGRALALEGTVARLERASTGLVEELEATRHTLSWRITQPLRGIRRMLGRARPVLIRVDASLGRVVIRPRLGLAGSEWRAVTPDGEISHPSPGAGPVVGEGGGPEEPTAAAATRLAQVARLVSPDTAPADPGLASALTHLERTLEGAGLPPLTAGWLAWVATRAVYPTERQLERITLRLELGGAAGLVDWVRRDIATQVRSGRAALRPLQPVPGVVVDVTDLDLTDAGEAREGTFAGPDVVAALRQTVGRWLVGHRPTLLRWDDPGGPAALGPDELGRFGARSGDSSGGDARAGAGGGGAGVDARERPTGGRDGPAGSSAGGGPLLVPWRASIVLPGPVLDDQRAQAYRALARSGVVDRLAAIGHDLVPLAVSENVAPATASSFVGYLGVLKYTHRLSAVSSTSAQGFAGLCSMLPSQGLVGPDVAAQPLPPDEQPVTDADLERARARLALDSLPMVLVVGDHEPRTNHARLLVAAERLWRDGLPFHLVILGRTGWRGASVATTVNGLRAQGRPVQVVGDLDPAARWAAYRLARFVLVPSLADGAGLAIAEPLRAGTPVVTSNFGTMAEVAEGGGAVLVDPRQPDAIEAAMRRLLDGDDLWLQMRQEAAGRTWTTRDEYARQTWQHLVCR